MFLTLVLLLSFQGCIIAPLRVAETLDVKVVDAQNGALIQGAKVIYFVCDIHDFQCKHATIVRTTSNESGDLKIEGHRKWGVWIPAPGGLPVPNHFIAIWAPGYSAFVFGQYGDTVESIRHGFDARMFLKHSIRFRVIDPLLTDRSIHSKSLAGA